ncbi:MAG: hypothetical protein ACLQK4_00490 [Acidimicrobiales bacterium]|jgi:hypothetical protein
MDTVVSDEAREYVKARGGVVFVRAHSHQCCHGSTTFLDTTTKPPRDRDDFVSVSTDEIDVRFLGSSAGEPHELVIELRGVLRRHPVSYWDGCLFKL